MPLEYLWYSALSTGLASTTSIIELSKYAPAKEKYSILQSGVLNLTNLYALKKFQILIYLTAVSGVGSSPTQGTCETSQVLPAGLPGVFSQGSPIFSPHLPARLI